MKGVNLVAETGLGEWLAKRRSKLGLSPREVAAAAEVSTRTVQRYENDQSVSYETLRVLDALGIRLVPALPKGSAGSLNTELHQLGARLERLEGEVREAVALTREALQLLREAQQRALGEQQAQRRGG